MFCPRWFHALELVTSFDLGAPILGALVPLNDICFLVPLTTFLSDINVLTYNPLRVAEVWMDDYR